MEIVKAKHLNTGCLKGSFDLLIAPWFLQINGCTVWQKGTARWVNFPSWKFKDDEGNDAYAPYVKLTDKDRHKAFTQKALGLWDAWVASNPPPQTNSSSNSSVASLDCDPVDEDLPF